MAAGYSINQAINSPTPGPGTFRAGSVMQAGLSSILEARLGGWMSPLVRMSDVSADTYTVYPGTDLPNKFAYVIQGIGFVSRVAITNLELALGTSANSTLWIDRTENSKINVTAGRYYLMPIENGLSTGSLTNLNSKDLGFAGSWPMTDHQWCFTNNAVTAIPYSRPFEHTISTGAGGNTGLPAAGTYDSNTAIQLSLDASAGFSLLFLDIYGSLIRRA